MSVRLARHASLHRLRAVSDRVAPSGRDCFVAVLLAMTITGARHCEQSEAISRQITSTRWETALRRLAGGVSPQPVERCKRAGAKTLPLRS